MAAVKCGKGKGRRITCRAYQSLPLPTRSSPPSSPPLAAFIIEIYRESEPAEGEKEEDGVMVPSSVTCPFLTV
ncbi:unnamed protein product [Victoria cruziana]